MANWLLDSGGTGVIVGSVVATSVSTDAGTDGLTTTDGALTISVSGTAQFTLDFGADFNSAPVVLATPIGTAAATTTPACVVQAVTATDCRIDTWNFGDQTNAPAEADFDFGFVIIGNRNR